MDEPTNNSSLIVRLVESYRVPILTALVIVSMSILVSGGSLLSKPLPGGLPVGNILAALTLCLPALIAISLSRPSSVVRYVSVFSLSLAVAWLPVSIVLARDLALNFSGVRGDIWINFSVSVVVIVIASVLWATIDYLFMRHFRRTTNGRPGDTN